MKKRKIALGPGASSLILIVVVLSMCMLAVLTMLSAKNDENLSLRSVAMIDNYYHMSSNSEQKLADLDAILAACAADASDDEAYFAAVAEKLPDDMILDDETDEDHVYVSWTEKNSTQYPMFAELEDVLETCAEDAMNNEDYLNQVARYLPEGMTFDQEKKIITWTEVVDKQDVVCSIQVQNLADSQRYMWISTPFMVGEDKRVLECSVEILPLSESERFVWKLHRLTVEETEEEEENWDW